jgi:hypothetical protein
VPDKPREWAGPEEPRQLKIHETVAVSKGEKIEFQVIMRSNSTLSKIWPSKKARRKMRHSDAVETSTPSDMFDDRYFGMMAGASLK